MPRSTADSISPLLISGLLLPGLLVAVSILFWNSGDHSQIEDKPVVSGRPLSFPVDGITILFNADDPRGVFASDVDRAIKMGASWLQIQVAYYTRDEKSAGFPVFDRRTPINESLKEILDFANLSGCKVALHPILLIQDPESEHWRGEYTPVQPESWWNDYCEWMKKLADISESAKISILYIGSELTSLQSHHTDWRELIQSLRKRYSGALGYSANWDSWQNVSFHGDLDVLGLNAYFPLFDAKTNRSEKLTRKDYQARLLPHLSAMRRWSVANDTPLIFTEVGYPATSRRLDRPWDSGSGQSVIEDGLIQLEGFRSFVGVFGSNGPQKGIFFYALHGHDPDRPTGYTPIHKETRSLWTDYLTRSSQR